jgi:hypothetical protein
VPDLNGYRTPLVLLAAIAMLAAAAWRYLAMDRGILADFWAAMLVLPIFAGQALRRRPAQDFWQSWAGSARTVPVGWLRAVGVVMLLLGTMSALLIVESALAPKAPLPPAVVACRDYDTWILDPANGNLPPEPCRARRRQAHGTR